MTERQYTVALYSFIPFGPVRTKLLIKFFGNAENAWNAKKHQLSEINLSSKHIHKFIKYRKEFDPNYFDALKDLGINFVIYTDDSYPKNLKEIDDHPIVLYYRGDLLSTDINCVAIIGSRKMSSYGKRIAHDFSLELAIRGVTIVSGLALGIDAVAHKAAIEGGGRTLAVIASGLDNITPATNRRFAEKFIEDGNGAVISEYPLGYQPQRHDFAVRNRIISGLSKAVVVIEGERKSGTLLTASHAADKGKQVFAVPGQITSPLSGAPHFLLKNGALMVTKVEDILDELDMQLKVDLDQVNRVMPDDEIETELAQILENEPLHLDEIVRKSGKDTQEITSKLTMMEIKGMIKSLGGGRYSI